MNNEIATPNPFWRVVNVVLGAVAGALIAVPIVASHEANGLVIALVVAIAGGFIGFKRRDSHGFLYVALITIVLLSILFVSRVQSPQIGPVSSLGMQEVR